MSTDKQISDILEKYGEPMIGNVWKVQGTSVIYHKAIERIAAKAGILFDLPKVLRAERDEAVLMVSGKLGERADWTIGEALVGINYRVSGKQAAYVYAMAEKRARDRLVLKLIGLQGLLYSEEEADEFKQVGQQVGADASQATPSLTKDNTYTNIEDEITNCQTLTELDAVVQRRESAIDRLSDDDKTDLRKVYAFKKEALLKFGGA